MKNLRQFCMAVALTFMFTTATFAGHIGTPGVVQSPPPTTSVSTTTSGEISTDTNNAPAYEYSLVQDIVLELLRTMWLVL